MVVTIESVWRELRVLFCRCDVDVENMPTALAMRFKKQLRNGISRNFNSTPRGLPSGGIVLWARAWVQCHGHV